jgi:hypothetical protein
MLLAQISDEGFPHFDLVTVPDDVGRISVAA